MSPTKYKLSDARLALLVLFICFAFNMAGRGIADTYVAFLLPLEAEFGWSRSGISSVYSIYMLANGLSAPFVGILFDRWGSTGGLYNRSFGDGFSLCHRWPFDATVAIPLLYWLGRGHWDIRIGNGAIDEPD